jgi:predicted ATPase
MKVEQLRLKNFTAFEDATFEFSPGLNVLIGANATGKSHVLNAGYALLKGWDEAARTAGGSLERMKASGNRPLDKLADVFKPEDGFRRLIRAGSASEAEVSLQTEQDVLHVAIPGHARRSFSQYRNPSPCIFIPTREILTIYEGFIAAYTARELAFDETYFDLCVALSAAPLKEPKAAWASHIVRSLQSAIGGSVQLRKGRFYVGKLEAHLVAEGLKKVAMIVQLLRNGSIEQDGVLFWDEPEAGLNPRLVSVVARILLTLAGSGVQIILASHDYLLTNELSLAAEYETSEGQTAAPRFFCLSREKPTTPVHVESAETLRKLEHNPILEEFAAHYDRQHGLFVRDSED